MSFSKDRAVRIITVAVIIIITAAIFHNSLEDITKSHNTSGAIADIIAPSEDENYEYVDLIVRKTAHLVEYAALGSAVICLSLHFRRVYENMFFGFAFFYILAVAVIDEYLQNFSGRSSSTGDVILDFFGGLIGFGVTMIIYALVIRIKRRKNYSKS